MNVKLLNETTFYSGLINIRAKLPETAECWTGMCYFVKNVMKFLRELCLVLFGFLLNLWTDAIAKYRVHCFASMAIY